MITNIQVLRAVAAILVVFLHTILAAQSYHFSVPFLEDRNQWYGTGVDIFFIISGFIIVYIQNNKETSPKSFLLERIQRIVPLYWLLTISFSLLLFLFPQMFREIKFSISLLLKSLFFINFLSENYPLLYVGWTLEYEMLFYIIFSFSLLLKSKFNPLLICTIIFLVLIYLGMDSIILEFLYGMGIAYLYNHVSVKFKNIYLYTLLLLGCVSLIMNWDTNLPRFLLWGLPSLAIFIAFLYLPPIKNKSIITIGNSSYAIYLVQIFSIPLFYKILSKFSIMTNYYINFSFICVCILFTIVSGIVIHYIIEKPMLKVIRAKKVL